MIKTRNASHVNGHVSQLRTLLSRGWINLKLHTCACDSLIGDRKLSSRVPFIRQACPLGARPHTDRIALPEVDMDSAGGGEGGGGGGGGGAHF